MVARHDHPAARPCHGGEDPPFQNACFSIAANPGMPVSAGCRKSLPAELSRHAGTCCHDQNIVASTPCGRTVTLTPARRKRPTAYSADAVESGDSLRQTACAQSSFSTGNTQKDRVAVARRAKVVTGVYVCTSESAGSGFATSVSKSPSFSVCAVRHNPQTLIELTERTKIKQKPGRKRVRNQ